MGNPPKQKHENIQAGDEKQTNKQHTQTNIRNPFRPSRAEGAHPKHPTLSDIGVTVLTATPPYNILDESRGCVSGY